MSLSPATRTLAQLTFRRPPLARAYGRPRRGRGRGDGGNNNGNGSSNRAIVRGENYEEPSAGAKTSILYRVVGGLGACSAFSAYLYFVYNPGKGDRRFGRQRAEDDAYFKNDDYKDGDWDHLNRPRGGGNGWGDGRSEEGFGSNDKYYSESSDDPFARQDAWDKYQDDSMDGRTSSEARSRSTWA